MSRIAPSRGGGNAVPPSSIALDHEDPRIGAFADWIEAHDRRDWRAGHEATKRLRGLGISVVPVTARPGGGAA